MAINLSSQFSQNSGLPIEAHMVADDLTERDAIAVFNRWEGMQVYIIATTETWQLQGGITNADWVIIAGPGGSSNIEIGVTEVLSGTPNSILYIDPDGKLGQDNPNFTYDEDAKIMTLKDNVMLAIGNGGLSGALGSDVQIYSDGTYATIKIESPIGDIGTTNPYLTFQYFDIIGGPNLYVPFIYFGRNAGFGFTDGIGGFSHTVFIQDIYNHLVDGSYIVPHKDYPTNLTYGSLTFESSSETLQLKHNSATLFPLAIDGEGHYSFGSVLNSSARVNIFPDGTDMKGISISMPSSYTANILEMQDSSGEIRFKVFKDTNPTDENSISIYSGKAPPTTDAIINFSGASAIVATGNQAALFAVSTSLDAGFGGVIITGKETGIQTMEDEAITLLQVISDDDAGSVGIQQWCAVVSTEDWTESGNGTKIIFATTENGSIYSSTQLSIDHDGSIVTNISRLSTGHFAIFDSSSGYAFFTNVDQKRVGINTSTPDVELDILGDTRIQDGYSLLLGGVTSVIPNIAISSQNIGGILRFDGIGGSYNNTLFIYLNEADNSVFIGTPDPDTEDLIFTNRIRIEPHATETASQIVADGTWLSFPYIQSHTNPGEFTLQGADFPPFFQNAGDTYEIHAFGIFAGNNNTKRLRLYFGSSVIYDSGNTIQNGGSWCLHATVNAFDDNTLNACVTWNSNGTLVGNGSIVQAINEDLTSDVNIKVTSECTANGDIQIYSFRINFLPI